MSEENQLSKHNTNTNSEEKKRGQYKQNIYHSHPNFPPPQF